MILSGQGARYSKATQSKVMRCADELGYRVDINARALKLNRSLLIGVVLNEVNVDFAASFLQGFQSAIKDTDYSPLVFFSKHPEDEARSLEHCLDRQVDALLINCAVTPDASIQDLAEKLEKAKIPVIETFGHFLPNVTKVNNDNMQGSREATDYLIAQGHRHIAIVTHKKYNNRSLHSDAWEHYLGYEHAMRSHGLDTMILDLELDESLPLRTAFLRSGMGAMEYLAQLPNRPTALVCYNDLMAYGIIRGCESANMAVPGDISVIGQANLDPSGIMSPELTSIGPRYFEIGQSAGKTLLGKLNGEHIPSQTIKPILVIRESVSSPPELKRKATS